MLHHAYAAKTAQPVTEAQFDLLCDINYRLGEQNLLEPSYDEIHTRASEKAEEAAQTVLFVFPLFYLALALTMTAATILTPARSSQWPKDCSFPPSPPAQAHWPDEG